MRFPALSLSLLVTAVAAYHISFSSPYHIQIFTDYENSIYNAYRYVTHGVPDLAELDARFYDHVSSWCGTGVWIFYNEKHYVYNASYNHANTAVGVGECGEFRPDQDNTARSLRFAGHPNVLNYATINLYENANFAGREYVDWHYIPDVSTMFASTRSVIVTGEKPWTLYEEPHYQGASICIVPDQQVGSGDTVLNYGLVTDVSLPIVGSAKMMCEEEAPSSPLPSTTPQRPANNNNNNAKSVRPAKSALPAPAKSKTGA